MDGAALGLGGVSAGHQQGAGDTEPLLGQTEPSQCHQQRAGTRCPPREGIFPLRDPTSSREQGWLSSKS